MSRAFAELGAQVDDNQLDQLLQAVESTMIARGVEGVEGIQDLVERALMEQGFYDVAKAYILYRHHRAERRGLRQALAQAAGAPDRSHALSASSATSPTPPIAWSISSTDSLRSRNPV